MFIILGICAAAFAVIFATFIAVAASTRLPGHVDKVALYRRRTLLFLTLTPLVLVLLGLTLPREPYARAGVVPDQVVYVAARQYGFAMSSQPMATDADWAAHQGTAPPVQGGKLVEFRVTSFDVNHGFAIYDPDHHIVAQTQAMPGYLNRLQVRFARPGAYDVFCLEYCGLAHHAMRGGFQVVTGKGVL